MRKKILHLLSSNIYAGAENVVISLINSLSEKYEAVYVSPPGPIEKILKDNKIDFIPLEDNSLLYLNSLFRRWKPDIVHAHDFRASIKTALTFYPCKKISHLHQNPSWIRKINHLSLAYMGTSFLYNKIFTASQEILEEIFFSKIIRTKTNVLKNSLNVDDIISLSKQGPDLICSDLIFVGRLDEVKDPIRFINIFYKLLSLNPDLKAVMVGAGELESNCNDKIKELKIAKSIILTGFIENPYRIIKNSRILVITSKSEGFGLVAVEGMALGKPVISTSVGGLKSIVKDACGGTCNSDDEFVLKINQILHDKEYYDELSFECEKEALKYNNHQERIELIEKVYDNL